MWVFVKLILGTIRERGSYCIQVYLSFIQHKSLGIACNLEGFFFQVDLTLEFVLKVMNRFTRGHLI
jgi:hypothetical protein